MSSQHSAETLSKLVCADAHRAPAAAIPVEAVIHHFDTSANGAGAVRFARASSGSGDAPETSSGSSAQEQDDQNVENQVPPEAAATTHSIPASAVPHHAPTKDSSDVVCLNNPDGMPCDSDGAWCCQGTCARRDAFQASCGDLCPIGAPSGSDCTRKTDTAGNHDPLDYKTSSFCCPNPSSSKTTPPKCISGIHFADQCPEKAKLDASAGSAFFGSSVKPPAESPAALAQSHDGDDVCADVPGAARTKFCSTEKQKSRMPVGHNFDNEHYCCMSKCVPLSTYSLMCCSNNDGRNSVSECKDKMLAARTKAGYRRRIPPSDPLSDPETMSTDIASSSSSSSSSSSGSDMSPQDMRYSSRSKTGRDFMPPKNELDPFKHGVLKRHVKPLDAEGSVQAATMRFGPGAMSPPGGWDGGHETTKADDNSMHKTASAVPILPPAFRGKQQGKCCGQRQGKRSDISLPTRPTQLEPRSYQEFDPYPAENPVCPITTITVKREDVHVEGVSPKDIAQHLARFTGLWDVHKDTKMVQGQLYAPARLPFATLGTHFFVDIDGRSDFAGMSTPGGDAGEFTLALCALEKARSEAVGGDKMERLSLVDVRSLFRAWLHETAEKRKFFYMQTDHVSLSRLAKTIGLDPNFLAMNVTDGLDRKTRQLAIDLATLPEHVGSSHMRLLLSDNSQYGCRREIPEYVITAFWELLLADPEDPDNDPAISNALLYHVNRGYHTEEAVVSVYSMEGECPDSVPLLVPGVTPETDTGDTTLTQIVVNHPSAVSGMREALAAFLLSRADEKGELTGALLIRHINALGSLGLERTLQVVAPGKPRFAVFFTKDPI